MTMTYEGWRSLQELPLNTGAALAIRSDREDQSIGADEVGMRFLRWTPLDGVLLGTPAWRRFVPPARMPGVRHHAALRLARVQRVAAFGWLALGGVQLLAVAALGKGSGAVAAALFILALVAFSERRLLLAGSGRALFARAAYVRWLRSRRGNLVIAMCVMLTIAAIHVAQGMPATLGPDGGEWVRRLNMHLPDLGRQPYRLLTGALLHASAAHLLSNLALLGLVLPIALGMCRRLPLLALFIVANALGGYLQLVFGSDGFDTYYGVSAGVLALYGLISVRALRRPRTLPPGLGWALLSVAMSSTLAAHGLVASAATIAHVCGFGLGMLAGWVDLACSGRPSRVRQS